MLRSYIGRWHHKIRKFAAEIFQNAKGRPQICAKYFVWYTTEMVINSSCVMGTCVTISCRYCIPSFVF